MTVSNIPTPGQEPAPRAASRRHWSVSPTRWPVGAIFLLDLIWIIALFVTAFGLASHWHILTRIHDPFHGVVPFAVPWAGALGGVAISLVGLAGHAEDWRPARFGYWHIARPLLGLVFGTVAVLIVILVLQTVKPPTDPTGHYPPSGAALLAVLSFVVGYREATFRSLIQRVVDLILAPGPDKQTRPISIVPATIDFGQVVTGDAASQRVHIFNGSTDTVHLSAGSVSLAPASGLSVADLADSDIPPSGSASLTLAWKPPAATELASTLVVYVANLSLTASVTGSAVEPGSH